MRSFFESLQKAVIDAPVFPLRTTLVRCVHLAPFLSSGAPDYLFASKKPNRYNPAGVSCVYFAGNERTALAELKRPVIKPPKALYYAKVDLRSVLILEDEVTRRVLHLEFADLFAEWKRGKKPTKTQLLGRVLAEQGRICAIRFPSRAAQREGFEGFNVVIFGDCVKAPGSVQILGPTRKALQVWPE